MGLSPLDVVGIISYLLMIPVSGWLVAFVYVYMLPPNEPVDLNRIRLFLMAGFLVGAMIAWIGIHLIVTATTST